MNAEAISNAIDFYEAVQIDMVDIEDDGYHVDGRIYWYIFQKQKK